jgi:hypothetical protein
MPNVNKIYTYSDTYEHAKYIYSEILLIIVKHLNMKLRLLRIHLHSQLAGPQAQFA